MKANDMVYPEKHGNMIREVTQNDLNGCLEVIRAGFQTVADEFGLTRENCPTNGAFMPMERLRSDFDKGNCMLAVFDGGMPIAFMQLAKSNYDTVLLEKLAVLPQYRHRGYGKSLLDFAKARSAQLGAKRISISVIEENFRLKQWYEANGFTQTEVKTYPHLPFTVGYMEFLL